MEEVHTPTWENHLKRIREKTGYSQADVAYDSNVAQTTIAAIENGKLSGRKYMDSLANFFGVNPETIFPYYNYLTLKEAEVELNISPSQVSHGIDSGKVRHMEVGRLKLIHREDLTDPAFKKKSGPSMREVVLKYLQARNGSGATTDELMELFESEDPTKQKRSLQSILSRSQEFMSSKDGDHFVWKYQSTGTSR